MEYIIGFFLVSCSIFMWAAAAIAYRWSRLLYLDYLQRI